MSDYSNYGGVYGAREIAAEWREILRANRHVVGPPLIAAGAAAVATAAWWWPVAWWVFLAVWVWVLWTGAVSIPDLPQRTGVPAPGEQTGTFTRVWLWSRRHLERLYAVAGYTAGGAWSMTWSLVGPSVALAVAGAVALAPLWAAWWHHRRIRLAVAVEATVSAWGDGSEVGLAGTTAKAVAAGADWFKVKVTPAKGEGRRLWTHDDYRNAVRRVAALYGRRARDVTMGETDSESVVTYTIRTAERETVTPEVELELDRIAGPKRLGTTDDGEIVQTAYYLDGREQKGTGGQHGIAVGVTGSGKSSEANVDCKHAARAKDAGLIVWDFSFGAAELRAWAPVCWWFCTTPEEALASLKWLTALSEHRGARMKGRFHKPRRNAPAVVVVADEVASMFAPKLLGQTGDALVDAALADQLVRDRITVWETGLRLFRKYGISVRAKTQYGVDAALGGETAKQQLGIFRSVFRCNRDQDAMQIVPLALARTSLFPQDKPGTCHHLGPTVAEGGARLRVDFHDDPAIAAMVEAWRDQQPLPEAELQAHPLWLTRPTQAPAAEEVLDDGDEDLDDDGDELDGDGEGCAELEDSAGDGDQHDELDTSFVVPAGDGGPRRPGQRGRRGGFPTPRTSDDTPGNGAGRGQEADQPTDEPTDEPTDGPVDAQGQGPAQDPTREPAPTRRRMVASEDTLMATWGALFTVEGGWASSSELGAMLSYSPRWTAKLAGQLVAEGKAESQGRGRALRYRAVPRGQWPRDHQLESARAAS